MKQNGMKADANCNQERIERGLGVVDNAVLCSICSDVYDGAMVLKTCGHTFCSSCIRQNLEFQEKSGQACCPSCKTFCDARDLIPNIGMRSVVEGYKIVCEGCENGLSGAWLQYQCGRKLQVEAIEDMHDVAHQETVDLCHVSDEPRRRNPPRASRRQPFVNSSPGHIKQETWPPSENGGTKKPENDDVDIINVHENTDISEEEEDDGDNDEFIPYSKISCKPGAPFASGSHSGILSTVASRPKKRKEDQIETESTFVPCPICGKNVPSFYINSHIDQCLSHGNAINNGNESNRSKNCEKNEDRKMTNAGGQELEVKTRLVVPPKLVGTLSSEKLLKTTLKRYGLPTDGKKSEMIDRYNKFRLEVETANDKQEITSYEKLARRVAHKERQIAAASLLNTSISKSSKKMKKGSIYYSTTADGVVEIADGPVQEKLEYHHPRDIELTGCTFEELIEVTKQRDALRRKLNANKSNILKKDESSPAPVRAKCSSPRSKQPGEILTGASDSGTECLPAQSEDEAAIRQSAIAAEIKAVEEVILDSDDEDVW